MDCAAQFEQAVNALPGVDKASLNTMTGKLTVVGHVDLATIRRLGQEENYTIHPLTQQAAYETQASKGTTWELRRAILSGVHFEDGVEIRRCAVQNGVTIFTSLDTVKIVLDVLEEITPEISTINGDGEN